MSIEIIQAGNLSTIQDAGRFHHAHLGFPVAGFMDSDAARMANRMVGNDPGAAVIETTWTGVSFYCRTACSMAIAGAEFLCKLNGQEVNTDHVIQLPADSQFNMTKLIAGVRAYLAFAGGIDVPVVAGSKSTLLAAQLGGFDGRALQVGDVIELVNPAMLNGLAKPAWNKPTAKTTHIVRATPGPEVNLFTQSAIKQAFSQSYELTSVADRQGFRLKAAPIETDDLPDISSSGLVPGTLQVTPDGQTILAMQDAQTTGGYPRILVVNQEQLSQLAQVRPGEQIYFFVA